MAIDWREKRTFVVGSNFAKLDDDVDAICSDDTSSSVCHPLVRNIFFLHPLQTSPIAPVFPSELVSARESSLPSALQTNVEMELPSNASLLLRLFEHQLFRVHDYEKATTQSQLHSGRGLLCNHYGW